MTAGFSDRLRQARKQLGLTSEEAAELAGLSRKSWEVYEREEKYPKISNLLFLTERGVDINWLLTGKGQMLPESQNPAQGHGNVTLIPVEPGGLTQVPVLDVRGSAGNGAMNFGEVISGYISLPTSYLRDQLGGSPKDVCGIYINGDSMEPALEDGGIALLDRSERARANKGDGIYTFRIGDELYIKRLQRQGSRIMVHSDNPVYEPWEISDHDKAQMKILARVVGSFRNL